MYLNPRISTTREAEIHGEPLRWKKHVRKILRPTELPSRRLIRRQKMHPSPKIFPWWFCSI